MLGHAATESTWETLKKEIRHIHGDREHMTRSQLRTVLLDYVEAFYNRSRHQARLGHRTRGNITPPRERG